MATDAALSLLSRYEALFELSGEINASTEVEAVGQVLVRRLKYVADVFSWRYARVEPGGPGAESGEPHALVVDGYRGKATVAHIPLAALGATESQLWTGKRTRFLEGDELAAARAELPPLFGNAEIVQLYVCPRFGAGELEAVLLFSKRREPLSDLDVKFLTLSAQLFHDKVSRLREQERRRELETAYLQQEIMLRQSEKLATLGRLSAGIAHEMNNPAAAALRNAVQLASELQELEQEFEAVGRAGLTQEQGAALRRHRASAVELARHPPLLDPLECSELEGEVEGWLDQRGVVDGWKVAPALVSMGYDVAGLVDLAAPFTREQLPAVLATLARLYSAHLLLEGIRAGTGRVTAIVRALRSYTYLDQAPIQTVDVHEGLNDTLTLLHDKLRDGVAVRREFAPDLPRIEAYGRELNQVWTNIIDNAVQAMTGNGTLTLRTRAEGPWVVVEIEDTGPGIAVEALGHIFDPFFTTKPPGDGAGLGLTVSHNIVVQKHGGRIEVRSQPGGTCFQVRLPLALNRGGG